jgi:hypothetical protein
MTESDFWEIIENAKSYIESYHFDKDDNFYERQAEAIANTLKNSDY